MSFSDIHLMLYVFFTSSSVFFVDVAGFRSTHGGFFQFSVHVGVSDCRSLARLVAVAAAPELVRKQIDSRGRKNRE